LNPVLTTTIHEFSDNGNRIYRRIYHDCCLAYGLSGRNGRPSALNVHLRGAQTESGAAGREQFHGIRGWMAKVDAGENGGMRLDQDFLLEFDGLRPHQVHLDGGDASSDSYCYSG
jgi:hypothetical protein